MRWYRGDCHTHTRLSTGGELTARELRSAARAAGLGFLVVTEHNRAAPPEDWAGFTGSGPLVLPGQEVVTPSGHWLALGLPPGVAVGAAGDGEAGAVGGGSGGPGLAGGPRLAGCLAGVRAGGGLCVVAHPHAPYPSGTFTLPEAGFDAVEVWNGPWTSDLPWQADNEAALAGWARSLARGGRARTALGNSDTHLAGQIGVPHTVVAADALTPGAILAGLRAGRCWIAGTTAVDLEFTVRSGPRTAGIGERLTPAAAFTEAELVVRGVPDGVATLHTDRGESHRARLPSAGPGTVTWRLPPDTPRFVRAEIRTPDGGMAALTNPIRLREWASGG